MKKVAVVVVHGIGWHEDGRHRGIVDGMLTRLMDPPASTARLQRALAEELGPVPHVVELAHWGKELEPTQERFEERYSTLRWDSIRRVIISALGDAAQYAAAVHSGAESSYPAHDRIHAVVAGTLAKLADACGPEAPLVLVGHSLGAHILSNHVYDEQQARAAKGGPRHGGARPLERMQTLAAFLTLGCNIPLFVMGTKDPTPIALEGAAWLNYYDRDDVLGFPLRPLYFPGGKPADYDLQDIEVAVGRLGSFGSGQTPLAHGYYWDNAVVVRGLAEQIRVAAHR